MSAWPEAIYIIKKTSGEIDDLIESISKKQYTIRTETEGVPSQQETENFVTGAVCFLDS